MLSAILSDTLLFKSPTTTEIDIETGNELAKIAGVEVETYGRAMFKAASTIVGMTASEVIHSDMKTFKFGESNMAIGQITTMDFAEISERRDEFIAELNKMTEFGKYKFVLLFVTDVVENGSYLFYSNGSEEILQEAFGFEKLEQGIYMDGVVSRKKQVLPPLLEIIDRKV